MKRKILSIALTLCMMLGMVSNEVIVANTTNTAITTAEQLQTALGGKEYASVSGDTVTLTKNVTINNQYNSIEIEIAGTITLDLAGNSIESDIGDGYSIILVNDTGDLTIKDSATNGNITCTGDVGKTIKVNGGKLNVESGTLVASKNNGYPLHIERGAVNISGGKFRGFNALYARSDTSVNICGGTFESLADGGKALDIHSTYTIPYGYKAVDEIGNEITDLKIAKYVMIEIVTVGSNTRNATLDLSGDSVSYYTDGTTTATKNPQSEDITDSYEGWEWYRNGATIDGKTYVGKVLVLNGTNITVPSVNGNAYGIKLPYDPDTVTIVAKGKNTITLFNNINASNYGIGSDGSITFDGDGRLSINTGKISIDMLNCGIFSAGQTIFNGITVDIVAESTNGNSFENSFGIMSYDTFTLNSGNITTSKSEVGIKSNNQTIINGGTVNITATMNGLESGISSININGGTGTVHGDEAALLAEKEIILHTDVEVKSGSLSGTDVTWGKKSKVNAVAPSITTDLSTEEVTYTKGDTAKALNVTAKSTDGGSVTYDWYSNDEQNMTTPTKLNVTTASYTPKTTTVGTTYYYCVVTNTNDKATGEKTASTTSKIAKVTVNPYKTYEVIEGNNQHQTVGTDKALTFKINGDINKFIGLYLNGVELEKADYEVKAGSVVITLKADYVMTLPVNKHVFTVAFTDGEALVNIEVKGKEIAPIEPTNPTEPNKPTEPTKPSNQPKDEVKSPQTGDNNNIWSYFMMGFVALCGIGFVEFRKKVKEKL